MRHFKQPIHASLQTAREIAWTPQNLSPHTRRLSHNLRRVHKIKSSDSTLVQTSLWVMFFVPTYLYTTGTVPRTILVKILLNTRKQHLVSRYLCASALLRSLSAITSFPFNFSGYCLARCRCCCLSTNIHTGHMFYRTFSLPSFSLRSLSLSFSFQFRFPFCSHFIMR